MDRTTEDIKNELGVFSKRNSSSVIFPATVLSYSSADDTISVQLSNDAVIDDVRLRSVIKSGNKIIFVPKVGSVVQIASIENSKEFIVIAVEEIDQELLMIGNVKVDIDATGIGIEKGASSLKNILTNIIEATQQILVIYGNNPDYIKLTQAQTDVNNLFK